MAADAKLEKSFVCVECGLGSKEIYKQFKGGNFKLCICKFCGRRVDKYVEYDSVLVFLDIILHKTQAYRHVVYNKPPKVYWQLGIMYLLCDSYIKWYNIKHKIPHGVAAMTDFSFVELQFYYMFLLSVLDQLLTILELVVFVLGIFLALNVCRLMTNKISTPRYQEILRVLLLSSFGKLAAFPAVIWGQTHSAVYLGLTKLFIFTSNVVAFKVLLTTSPSLFMITTGNVLLYCFVTLYTRWKLHEVPIY